MEVKIKSMKYEDFKDSELYECVEKCLEGTSIPVLSDAELAEYSVGAECCLQS